MSNVESIINEYQVANLTEDQKKKIQQLESEFGFTLIAYDNNSDDSSESSMS